MEHRVRLAFAQHSHNLKHAPVLAHYEAAMVSTLVGCAFAVARGIVVASMQPPGQRLKVLPLATRGIAPLYIVPFVLGSQLDCYMASWERDDPTYTPTISGDASHLG